MYFGSLYLLQQAEAEAEAEGEGEGGGEGGEGGATLPQHLAPFLPVTGAVVRAQHVLVFLALGGTAVDRTVGEEGVRTPKLVVRAKAECHAFGAQRSTPSIAVLGKRARCSPDILDHRSLDAAARSCRYVLDMLGVLHYTPQAKTED